MEKDDNTTCSISASIVIMPTQIIMIFL